ncbi:hypothetical protein AGOR_G00203240 [Albula goreensis]|uniref:Uncharacterized protein n=1 Tax=Albula goreensis TaxID=1534307 RepID=A0A8T3CTV6_9TELE|nr:hypothetical protein AGOR_G00203240 [Albula goreensis]
MPWRSMLSKYKALTSEAGVRFGGSSGDFKNVFKQCDDIPVSELLLTSNVNYSTTKGLQLTWQQSCASVEPSQGPRRSSEPGYCKGVPAEGRARGDAASVVIHSTEQVMTVKL